MTHEDDSSSPAILVRHPVIVVCVPAYNEERFLAETLESLRVQTWTDFTALICDNASSDATPAIAQAMVERDPRFHYHRHERNIGGTGNFNFARESTDSPYLMWLGAHDRILPTFLEKNIAALERDPRLSVSAAYTSWIDDEGRVFNETRGWMDTIPNIPILRYVLEPKKNDLCGEINNVIRRKFLDGFRLNYKWGPDNVALAHLAYRGPFHYVTEPLYCRRDLKNRTENYMKRLTGTETRDEKKEELIDSLIDQLATTARNDPLRPLAAWIIRSWLGYRFGIRKSGATARLLGMADYLKARVLKRMG